jgi:peptide deformylase
MAIREIVRLGNPILRERASEIKAEEVNTPWLSQLVQDLWDSMEYYGGVGIAAPQIGVNRRVFVFGFEKSERYPQQEPVARTVLCNPEVIIIDNEPVGFYEGCLSVTDLRGQVLRPRKIIYRGFDQFGNAIEHTATDFHARIVLHELDHLDGTVFIDRVKDTRTLGFREELIKYQMT